jgi:wyosine [tRNA(Phe)-imidazoG37] synthetase (radical SAM superfamily)
MGDHPVFNYIFGPVLSSRLGSSLGVDLLGGNICSFDCLYCESGKTQIKTVQRAAYVSQTKILEELKAWFAQTSQKPDYITLGGPGEPCLNSQLGRIITSIKLSRPDIPLAVLTNSSLLSNPQVCEELGQADVVLPSLDSMVEDEFIKINRPHPDIRLEDIVRGLLSFRAGFAGKIFLEVLLLPGINDSEENFRRLKEFQNQLKPDRVDISVMSRPGAYVQMSVVDKLCLERWRREFKTITSQRSQPEHGAKIDESRLRDMIAASVKRRPQTPEQLSAALGADLEDIVSMLRLMEQSGEVEAAAKNENAQKFYIKRG